MVDEEVPSGSVQEILVSSGSRTTCEGLTDVMSYFC